MTQSGTGFQAEVVLGYILQVAGTCCLASVVIREIESVPAPCFSIAHRHFMSMEKKWTYHLRLREAIIDIDKDPLQSFGRVR